jgi:hypothetical protein
MQHDPPILPQIFDIVWHEWRAIVNTVTNFRVLEMTENAFTR